MDTQNLMVVPRVVDNTILSHFRTCHHKALWEFAYNLAPIEPNINLHAGSAFAAGLEALYRSTYTRNEPQDLALTRANLAFNNSWGIFSPSKPTTKSRLHMWEALLSYLERYDPPNDYIEPSPLFKDPFEYTFAIPMTKETIGFDCPKHPLYDEPFIYAGRFDMIGQQYGQLRIRDDKTTTQLGPSWEKQWTLSSQFMGYCCSMQILGYSVDTAEIRGIGILKDSISHVAVTKTYTSAQLSRWRWQVARDLANFVRCYQTGEWEYNFSSACTTYGGCDFLELCRANNGEDYFDSYAKRTWNPLGGEAQ